MIVAEWKTAPEQKYEMGTWHFPVLCHRFKLQHKAAHPRIPCKLSSLSPNWSPIHICDSHSLTQFSGPAIVNKVFKVYSLIKESRPHKHGSHYINKLQCSIMLCVSVDNLLVWEIWNSVLTNWNIRRLELWSYATLIWEPDGWGWDCQSFLQSVIVDDQVMWYLVWYE